MGPRFFLPLLVRLAVVAAGPLAVGWWFLGPIGGGVAALVILGLELWRIDRAVRTGAEDRVSFKSTPPTDLTWLDEAAIRDALRELRTLGFFPIADCTYSVPVYSPGFVRLLAQSPQRVYACVAQGRRGTHNPEPVAVTLFSVLADGRTLTTTSAQPHATMALGLEAVDSWQIRPGRSAHELMVEHLATRAELCAPSATLVAGDGTLDTFIAMQRGLYHRQAQECRMNGALAAMRRGLRWEGAATKSWIEGRFTKVAPLVAPPMTPMPDPASATVAPTTTQASVAAAPPPAASSVPAPSSVATAPPSVTPDDSEVSEVSPTPQPDRPAEAAKEPVPAPRSAPPPSPPAARPTPATPAPAPTPAVVPPRQPEPAVAEVEAPPAAAPTPAPMAAESANRRPVVPIGRPLTGPLAAAPSQERPSAEPAGTTRRSPQPRRRTHPATATVASPTPPAPVIDQTASATPAPAAAAPQASQPPIAVAAQPPAKPPRRFPSARRARPTAPAEPPDAVGTPTR